MLLFLALIQFLDIASALVARAPVASPAAVCKSGIYTKLAPLATYAPAQAFCAAKYPKPAVTVTAKAKVRRVAPSTTPAAPSTTPRAPSTTPAAPSTTPRAPSTTRAATTTTRSTTTSSPNGCSGKDALPCLFSSVAGEVAKTVSNPLMSPTCRLLRLNYGSALLPFDLS